MSSPLYGRQNFEIDQQNLSLSLLNVFSYASLGFCKYVYVVFFLLLNILRGFLSSRVFIKILFQELAEYMGLPKLNERLKDP